jgi:hypothetical protein
MSEPTIKREGNGIHVQFDGGAEESNHTGDVSGKNSGMMQIDMDGRNQKATVHGPATVQTANTPAPETPLDTIKTTWGSPCQDIRKALANPDKYTIKIGPNQRTTIQSAIAAGIYTKTPDGNLVFADEDRHNVSHEAPAQEGQFMTPQNTQNLRTLRSRMGEAADAMIMQVLANGGKSEMDSKTAAALDRFASDAGAPDRDAAINFVNRLVEDVFDHAADAIAARFPNVDAYEVCEFILQDCDHTVRTSTFISLYHGRSGVLNEMVERYNLGNKS